MGQQDKYTKGSLKGQILIDEKNGQILGYPLQQGYGIPNLMAGNFVGPGGVASPTTSGYTGGFRVAKPGFDVRSASASQLIFDSNYNVFKIVSTDTISIPACSANSRSIYTLNHNLNFIPVVFAFYNNGTVSFPLPYIGWQQSGGNITIGNLIDVGTISANSVIFESLCNSITSTAATPIKYYLCQETAN